MSTFVNLDSVCGKKSASVDIFDLDANPNGVVCCDIVNAKGGKVITIQLVDGFSTTKLIEKMKG
jgi:bifunctional ADP-heptose synthase (sugar kinase/adenylyltransferase)